MIQFRVTFIVYPSRVNSKGDTSIFCRVSLDGDRKQFSTRIVIPIKYWNSKRASIKASFSRAKEINLSLFKVRDQLEVIFADLTKSSNEVSLDLILRVYHGEKLSEPSLLEVFQHHNESIEKQLERGYAKSTIDNYKYILQHLKDFLNEELKIDDISLTDLNVAFLKDFQSFLRVSKNHQPNTFNKITQRVRKVVRYAMEYDLLDRDPFLGFKQEPFKKDIVFLSEDELQMLENYHFKQRRLEQVRYLFLFCCYTGLAYNELSRLKRRHLYKDKDRWWLKMERKKTDRMFELPILSSAIAILEHYHPDFRGLDDEADLLPKISLQKMNSYLKEVAEVVGINKPISSHVGRKSYASTVLLNNDVPMQIVSKLLGHSSIKITEDFYGVIVNSKLKEEIDRVDKKRGD